MATYWEIHTGTYDRWLKRQHRKMEDWIRANEHHNTPAEDRANENYALRKLAHGIGHGNRFRARHNAHLKPGQKPLPGPGRMPKTIRHLSRAEINHVRRGVKASTGRNGH